MDFSETEQSFLNLTLHCYLTLFLFSISVLCLFPSLHYFSLFVPFSSSSFLYCLFLKMEMRKLRISHRKRHQSCFCTVFKNSMAHWKTHHTHTNTHRKRAGKLYLNFPTCAVHYVTVKPTITSQAGNSK